MPVSMLTTSRASSGSCAPLILTEWDTTVISVSTYYAKTTTVDISLSVFSKLLLPHDTPPIINPTKSKSHRDKTKRQVTDLRSWLEAWNRYLCTRVAANPSVVLELAKYQTMMVMFFKHHPADACKQYDKLFRQEAAQDRTLRWDSIKNDIYIWAVTQPPASQRTQSFRDKVPVLARLGPPTTPTSSNPS